jgi:cytochrome c5
MSGILGRAVLWSVLTIGIATAAGVMGQGRGGGGGGSTPAPAPAPAGQGTTDQTGFPDGDGKALVLANCGGCHDLDMVKNAKHDAAGWKETVTHMVTYGAGITDAQVPTVAGYLAKAFPVQTTPPAGTPPATTPPATPPAQGGPDSAKDSAKKEDPDVAGERILNTACTTCHDLGPVTRRADDKASWEGIVYGMVGNGADVKDADIPILVDYLVKTYGPPKDAPKAPAAPAAPAGRGGRGARGQ